MVPSRYGQTGAHNRLRALARFRIEICLPRAARQKKAPRPRDPTVAESGLNAHRDGRVQEFLSPWLGRNFDFGIHTAAK